MYARHHVTHHARSVALVAGIGTASLTAIAIFALGRLSGSVQQHGALVLAASGVTILVLWQRLRHQPALRDWSVGGIVVALAVALLVGGALSRPTSVDEAVVTADVMPVAAAADERPSTTPATEETGPPRNTLVARGELEPLAHAGRGTASIIRTASGKHALTLTGFETDPGPDLVVWLVAGNPSTDGDVERGRHVSLGRLKGTSGSQQYLLPADVDPSEFTHAYVWCRAFSVGFTRAALA